MKKKNLITLITVCTILFAFGMINASAETSGTCGTNLTWTLDDSGTLTISGQGTMTNWTYHNHASWYSSRESIVNVVIEDSVTSIGVYAFDDCSGLTSITIPDSVTSIGNSAFWGCSSLTSIAIPDSVTSIGSSAFGYCSGITNITIPDSVTSIGNSAFYGCSSLTSITIPDSVTSIGRFAFDDCSSLTSITIPNGVTSIGDHAFSDCSSLTKITIPDSVTSISDGAFSDCSSLTSITIPNGVTSIGDYAFYGCSSLTSITIPNGVTSIGDYAFPGCSRLISITIPNGVTSIGNAAFSECSSLTSIAIPDSVTSIGNAAFSECSSLTSIAIPDSVTSIGSSAFSGCSSLTRVNITDLEAWCNIDFSDFSSNPLRYAGKLYLNGNLITNLVIPNNITNIGNYAFYGCSSLTSTTIPDSVTSIGNYVFRGCSSLTSTTIPDSVTSIGNYVFRGCSSLTSTTIPDSVTSISDGLFYNCSNLEYVRLPAEITYIFKDAFNGCSNIQTVFYAGSEEQWNEIVVYSNNENLADAEIVYNAIKKTYKLETNCNNSLADITDYAIFNIPIVENSGMTLTGWYDNASLSGEPVTFPYYGDATTLYAAWADRTGKSFDDALIAKANQQYTVSTIESEQLVYFEFVPNHTKEYHFYTSSDKGTCGYLYDSNKSQIASNDGAGEGNNFYISYNLTAEETYYISAKLYSGTGTFTFVVEEPVDYRINEITIKDMSGNSLQAIPTGTFLASISFTNVSSSADTVIVLAQYSDVGAFKGLMYIQTEDVPTGSTIKLSIPVDNSKGDVATLKAFCWESFASLTPMGNSASFPVE